MKQSGMEGEFGSSKKLESGRSKLDRRPSAWAATRRLGNSQHVTQQDHLPFVILVLETSHLGHHLLSTEPVCVSGTTQVPKIVVAVALLPGPCARKQRVTLGINDFSQTLRLQHPRLILSFAGLLNLPVPNIPREYCTYVSFHHEDRKKPPCP